MSPDESQDIFSASRDLVAAVRDLMVTTSICDVDVSLMGQARDLVERANMMLGTRVRPVGRREPFDQEAIVRSQQGEAWEVFAHNPMGIPLKIAVRGAHATAAVTPTAVFEGPPGMLHGGFAAAMMDALLSTLVQAQGIRAVTVRLEVNFRKAAAVGHELQLGGTVKPPQGRKIHALGWIRQGANTIAEAELLSVTVAGDPD
jgi:acyl-coenzyme A thioesterase PaaI-like protein